DLVPNLALVLLVLAGGAHLERRERLLRAELAAGVDALTIGVPAPVLHAEGVDGDRLLRRDREVLSDLPILSSAFHDRAGEHEDRSVRLVLDDQLVHGAAAAAAFFAHFGAAALDGVVEGRERAEIGLRLGE